MGLCNDNFRKLKTKELSDIPLEYQVEFSKVAANIFYHILINVLESLDKQSILTWERTYRFINKEDNSIKIANFKEKTLIQQEEKKMLNEIGYESIYSVMRFNKQAEFYEKLTPLLEQKGFYNCFKVYRIGFTESCLSNLEEYIDSLEDITSAKLDINNKSYKELNKKFESIFYGQNTDMNIEFDFTNDSKNWNEHDLKYSNIKKLIELTIPCN